MTHTIFKKIFLAFVGLTFGLQAWSQGPTFNGSNSDYPEVEVGMTFSKYPKDIKVGDVVTLCFKTKALDHKWHLYSSISDDETANKPTEFFIFEEDSKGAKLNGKMTENKTPKSIPDEIMGGYMREFKEHEVTFCQKIKITEENVKLEAEFAFQYCLSEQDGGQCKFAKYDFLWDFKAQPAEGGSQDAAVNPVDTGPDPEVDPVETPQDTGMTASDGGHGSAHTSGHGDSNASAPCDCGDKGLGAGLKNGFNLKDANGIAVDYTPIAGSMDSEGCTSSKIWSIFLIAFGAGLVSLFTPCVFPMIPLTVSYFVKQGEGDDGNARRKGIRNGFIYSVSIFAIYAILGLAITMLFGPTALYEFASNPWANLAFFAVFFVFALSFFGLFDLTLPSSFSSKISTKAGSGGTIGIFLMALTLVIVSFSCTGPILGSLVVGVANSDCFWAPVAGFAGFGVAFGIPFGLLALFPSTLKALPSSGGWLNSVKVVLGFLELAMCMKFLSNSDLIWHWGFLNREVFIGIWIVLFFLLGLYLLGKIRLPHDDEMKTIPVPRLILAIFSFSFMMYLYPGLNGSSLHLIEGFLPGFNDNVGVKLLPNQVQPGKTINDKIAEVPGRRYVDLLGDHESTGFNMFFDLQEALYFGQQYNVPVFVDFTGHSCANCRNMENSVWISSKVRKLMKEEMAMVALFADDDNRLAETMVTDEGKKLRRLKDFTLHYQSSKFGVVSQPYYVMLDPFDPVEPLSPPLGYSSEADFFKMLEDGIAKYKEKSKARGN